MKRSGTNPSPPVGAKPAPPPNPPKKRSKVQVKLRVPTSLHKALTAIAAARGESLTATINGAVDAYVKEAKKERSP